MKPHVLFVTEKWTDADPKKQITNNQHNLFGSLEMTGLATYECVHYDEYYVSFGKKIDEYLIKKVSQTKPDLVVVCPLPWYPHCPSQDTYRKINSISKVVFIWADAAYFMPLAKQLEDCSTLSVLWDMDTDWKPNTKFLHLWTPQDPRLYYADETEKDIDVCFLGNPDYPERRKYLEFLEKEKVKVYIAGGRNKNYVSFTEYANLLRRSKISLNFSLSSTGIAQLKGRIHETMFCNAMLMESHNDKNWIDRWFVNGIHYVSFANTIELKEKIEYYLKNDKERKMISLNGNRLASENYSNTSWWKTVFYESNIT